MTAKFVSLSILVFGVAVGLCGYELVEVQIPTSGDIDIGNTLRRLIDARAIDAKLTDIDRTVQDIAKILQYSGAIIASLGLLSLLINFARRGNK